MFGVETGWNEDASSGNENSFLQILPCLGMIDGHHQRVMLDFRACGARQR